MAKYRLLKDAELLELEEDFVKYLVVNGIDADSWKSIKDESPDKARKIVDLFSDVVFEKVFRSCQFLEITTSSYIKAVQCLDDKMIMAAITAKDESLDLVDYDLSQLKLEEVELYKGEKQYDKEREVEIFELTEKGYTISDGQLYKALMLLSVE